MIRKDFMALKHYFCLKIKKYPTNLYFSKLPLGFLSDITIIKTEVFQEFYSEMLLLSFCYCYFLFKNVSLANAMICNNRYTGYGIRLQLWCSIQLLFSTFTSLSFAFRLFISLFFILLSVFSFVFRFLFYI